MGSLGADEAGEDMTVGRTNKSEERTILVATARSERLRGRFCPECLDRK